MREEKKKKRGRVPFFSSIQMKYAMSYLAIVSVVLILLNTYPVLASQDLLFGSKRDSLKSQAAVMASALMELELLPSDQVERVMTMLYSSGLTRVVVTDPAGLILYDSTQPREKRGETAETAPVQEEPEEPQYRYALYQEVVLALGGNDVTCSEFSGQVFRSTAAVPIVYRNMTIGCVYICEEDAVQGALLLNLQKNLRSISLVVAAVTLVMSLFFAQMLSSRFTALLSAIRIVGEGEYGHRLQPSGRDELALLAEEFNQLTDRLQTTEEVRRRFVSDASHELKTPLASIRLLADSILQNETMDQVTLRDFVSDIGTEADRLTRITEHLLALTRLDSLPAAETFPVDVSAVTRRALSMLAPVADAAGVALGSNLKDKCVVQGTEDDLYQICFNLLENGIKYNRPGGRVMADVYRDGDQVLLEVSDTGVGIPEEDMPKVFNRFYRVDKARSRAAGGTGLGLSIVRATGDGSPSGPASRRAACSRWAFPLCRKNGRRETGDEAVDDVPAPGAAAPAGVLQHCRGEGRIPALFRLRSGGRQRHPQRALPGGGGPGPSGINGGSALRSHGGGAEQPLPQRGVPAELGAGGGGAGPESVGAVRRTDGHLPHRGRLLHRPHHEPAGRSGGSGDQCGRAAGELPEPPDPDSRGGGALPAGAGAGGPE